MGLGPSTAPPSSYDMRDLSTIPQSATWLDVLPLELCVYIAKQVNGGMQTMDGLHLALTSQTQTRAVWRSVSHHILINFETGSGIDALPGVRQSDEERTGWAHAFAEYPVEISVRHSTSEAIDLLRSGNIVTANISADDSAAVEALCESRSVKKLRLYISRHTDLFQMFRNIASLSLEELVIREDYNSRCEDLVQYAKASAEYARTFECQRFNWEAANSFSDVSRSYWDAIAVLPTFAEIFLTAPPPEQLFSTLSQFRDIKLHDVQPSIAARLGSAVVWYECHKIIIPDPLTGADLMELAGCPRMRILIIHVNETAKEVLVDLVSHLPCLEVLIAFWAKAPDEEAHESPVDLSSGVILRTVKASPNLERLSVRKARVPLSEWEAVITHIGVNLKMLGIEYDIGGTELCDLLLAVLSMIPRLSEKMQYLRIGCRIQHGLFPDGEKLAAVLRAVRRTQMALPTLNEGKLEEEICSCLFP